MMDRMFEQSQKLMNDNLSFWTAQATQASERLMSQGDAFIKATGDLVGKTVKASAELVGTTVKEQTALFETLGKHVATTAQQQVGLFTQAFKPAA